MTARRMSSLAFQPTLPSRGATHRVHITSELSDISTHAPLAGSDITPAVFPRKGGKFQPTLPSRGATEPAGVLYQAGRISTHAPLAGSDSRYVQIHTRKFRKIKQKLLYLWKISHSYKTIWYLRTEDPLLLGANLPYHVCTLPLRTATGSVVPPAGRMICFQNALSYSHNDSRDNKIADCPFPDP